MATNKSPSLKRIYSTAVILSIAVLVAVFWRSGGAGLWAVFVLAILEITFSFENAIINSQVLSKIAPIWRKIFLTIGIAVAVFGVRLLLPVVLVAATTHTSLGLITKLAFDNPDLYALKLHHAYPMIAAFGGFFLLMISLHFMFSKHTDRWFTGLEKTLTRWYHPWLGPLCIGFFTVLVLYLWQGKARGDIYVAAFLGIFTFLVISILSEILEKRSLKNTALTKHSWRFGLVQFFYLEILDASFSFDGVIAAFAITKEVLLIAAGLGIGAFYVRSMTVHLLEKGTLTRYKYLAHGAHYAIGALAIILIVSISYSIPEVVTGLVGLTIIGLSVISSVKASKKEYNQTQI